MTSPPATADLSALFSPVTLGPCVVRNRIATTPHFTRFAVGGLPSARHLHYWSARARGGVGLIMGEFNGVHPSTSNVDDMVHLWNTRCIEAFKPIAAEVQKHGAKLFAQIGHLGGLQAPPMVGTVSPLWGVSAKGSVLIGPAAPSEMTVTQIHEIIAAHATGARRLKEAGLNGVEISCAHAHLPEQFLSTLSNHRTDDYGGSLSNRARFIREVVAAVRAEVGRDFALGIRLSTAEFMPGGYTIQDMREIYPHLGLEGQLDFLHVCFSGPGMTPPSYYERGRRIELVDEMRRLTKLPLIFTGRVTDPVFANELIATKRLDVVGMTRAFIADPELANKAARGKQAEIRTCISCCEGCYDSMLNSRPIGCSVNPEAGREGEVSIARSVAPKKILVVGGGVAGMEAARVAALAGHRVTLWERAARIGGQYLLDARAPGRASFASVVRYYEEALPAAGVQVRVLFEGSSAAIQAERPDLVLIATGAQVQAPVFPGGIQPAVVSARSVLEGSRAGRVVGVLAGAKGMEALEAAHLLSERGHVVHLIVPAVALGDGVERNTAVAVIERLKLGNVQVHLEHTILSYERSILTLKHINSGVTQTLADVDTVVTSLPPIASPELTVEGVPSRLIGSCREGVVTLMQCTRDAYDTARAL